MIVSLLFVMFLSFLLCFLVEYFSNNSNRILRVFFFFSFRQFLFVIVLVCCCTMGDIPGVPQEVVNLLRRGDNISTHNEYERLLPNETIYSSNKGEIILFWEPPCSSRIFTMFYTRTINVYFQHKLF